ncbi:glycosyltransferase [Pelagicoccus sp. SDUM812005]|uniref:glycosyltransferase n=1 Tax=Pelagicoccus sp. SDUM812005 TaxID=3041257 RepID=UPI00280CAFD7|nr:glycosyltransferase [Pelagicoccus sp. SDUM812005]MDQ8182366.1 glycosyltransferase [Pelagicoccus sp. SDUM812005]
MNILFANYGDYSTNSLNHIGPFANYLSSKGHDCIVAVRSINDTLRFLEEKRFKTFTFADILATPFHFHDGNPANILHAWTPRINVHTFTSKYKSSYPNTPVIIHFEDNEEAILEKHYRKNIADLSNAAFTNIHVAWEESLSHPIDYKAFTRSADAFTYIIDPLKEFLPTNKPSCRIFPGLAPSSPFKATTISLKEEALFTESEFIIAYPGGVSASNLNDILDLYKAIKKLQNKGHSIKIAKTGPNSNAIESSLPFNIDEVSIDLGFLSKKELNALLNRASFHVQPGKDDEFNKYRLPSKLPEFLATGKAVITGNTNIGPSLKQANACLLLNESTPEEIAEKIEYLIQNPTIRKRIGTNGRRFSEEKFNLEVNGKKLEQFYADVIKEAKSDTFPSRNNPLAPSRIARSRFANTLIKTFKSLRYTARPNFNIPLPKKTPEPERKPPQPQRAITYEEWIKEEKTRDKAFEKAFSETYKTSHFNPLISIVLPTYNPHIPFLVQTIESVLSQTYKNWELCIADDATQNVETKRLLTSYAETDERIKVLFRKQNGNICKATNSAITLSQGDFISFLDHDDTLARNALARIVDNVNRSPNGKLFYTDEDKIDENNNRHSPHFKSNWNPNLLLGQNYISHLSTYSKSLINELGGLRCGTDGSQDWDLALRASQIIDPKDIIHIPEVLYHWRVHEGSTALSLDTKPYIEKSDQNCLAHYYRSPQTPPRITKTKSGHWKHTHPSSSSTPISLHFHFENDYSFLADSFELIQKSKKCILTKPFLSYNPNTTVTPSLFAPFKSKLRTNIFPAPTQAEALNTVCEESPSDAIIISLRESTVPASIEDLLRISAQAHRPEIGSISGKIITKDGSLYSVGLVETNKSLIERLFNGLSITDDGYYQRAFLPSNYNFCDPYGFAFRKSVWMETSGFNTKIANDRSILDFFTKSRISGYQCLTDAHSILLTSNDPIKESYIRIDDEPNSQRSYDQSRDPFLNPNLQLIDGKLALKNRPLPQRKHFDVEQ